MSVVTAEQRWRGFSMALMDAGIDPRQISRHDGAFTKEWAYQSMQKISDGNFSGGAIFMGAQMLIEGVLDWWKVQGAQIPNDIHLCGFDDHPFFDYLNVPISTVEQNIQSLATTAVDVLMQHIEDSELGSQQKIIAGELRIRHE